MYIGKSVFYEEELLKEVFPFATTSEKRYDKQSLKNGQEIYFIGIMADTLFYKYPLNLIR